MVKIGKNCKKAFLNMATVCMVKTSSIIKAAFFDIAAIAYPPNTKSIIGMII